MPPDHNSLPKTVARREDREDEVDSVVMLDFSDEFGPVKVLQLFAAIKMLPKIFMLRPTDDEKGWTLMISVTLTPPVERVLAKIRSMPCLASHSSGATARRPSISISAET
mgnify:CR=1 FL=1